MERNDPYLAEFLPDALNDMTEIIAAFVMLGSKQGAVRIKDKMNKTALRISEMPYAGIKVSDSVLEKYDLRMAVVEKYLMFYRIFEEEHRILFYRVLNGKSNYPVFLNRYLEEAEE